ncbi:GRIP and coiled-coil domain-containing protein 1 [Fopius arisanus]|uniref:GRIP and coiled-coil domain-containing protein 1 n=1 Tax=Fopius arisanus TaxID=64838 RepID=A0A0C9RKN3_9HYME|nr:PREDICTED: GRIP and coiled-coil domain-containing protein 1 [Fopius arisanus]
MDKITTGNTAERQKKIQYSTEYQETPKTSHTNHADTNHIETKECEKIGESVEELKNQLGRLMNSLATLSAEKSRMEANFQTDRKALRSEREDCDRVIKELRDKLRRAQQNTHSELQHMKYKLIMECHEREKEQIDNSVRMKELQRVIADERRSKEAFEQQIKEMKNHIGDKTQNKILEAELEIANNKLKQAETAVKETPPILVSLQSEMTAMKKQHRMAIHEEQKRAVAVEQQAKILERAHELRVASLESRLAELSETVGGYDRLRQQDQLAIQKLKNQLLELQKHNVKEYSHRNVYETPETISTQIKELYGKLLDISNEKNNTFNVEDFLQSLNLRNISKDIDYKENYEILEQDFENYKQQMSAKLESANDLNVENERADKSTELYLARTHAKNLEERIRMLNKEASDKASEINAKLEQQIQQIQEERMRFERILSQKETEFRSKVGALEHQILRQRERSLALLEEKDREITTLKSSFRSILMKHEALPGNCHGDDEKKSIHTNVDFVTSLLTVDSPPMLHYAHELARRDIQVSGLRKLNSQLEATLRENQRDLMTITQRHAEEIKTLENKITRLEAYKSREGANLEYLKNVIVNFLTSNDASSRRHMLNAIGTVLRFTPDEMEKIQHAK